MTARRRMSLIAYLKAGPNFSYPSSWRHPASALEDILTPERWEHTARALEAACFDACFFADGLGIPDLYKGSYADYVGRGGQLSLLDPMTLLPMMARVTQHLGLGVTLSTTFMPPYILARWLGSLDILSHGRAAWNVVTTARDFEARNCGLPGLPPKEQRYDMADEVLEACDALWGGWDEDALVFDRESGRFADPGKIRRADYEGRYVRTEGPLSIPRSPQVRPVLMQAGSSPRGREFAARWGEALFCTPATKEDAAAYRADIHARMDAIGRPPGHCAVLPSVTLVVGETESIAREKAAYLESLVDPELVLAASSWSVVADLSRIETPEALEAGSGNQGVAGHRDRMLQVARQHGISFAEAVRRPRALLAGTPKQIADWMEDWFTSGACDGFILPPTMLPATFEEFGRMVVPELQRRGLVRTGYAGRTLRENLRDPG
ncbi:NtaA/DmoA family FMN-dependent monooxygenase [Siccirubricoccus sp. KC 17139]|uniref:NtaA/DmoA family FMN-dependent monooxygenase n=1 Tax=Siccirubricoccus soli TaxID=2899147 RepID=A0ABT1D9Y6_9PROT|nr:NtaA/DmoA family FMN-dependent monooxygenase [Siccirubricoccus soli]MCO6418748.1 NtaA/DmoA family FMN-dependent monooxygenase [Siccirubricoccus soli]MCP2684883.1 NtaA/DmoA family FMN-dependent monooxygenase [Siccirubricoccus soli]